MSNDDLGPEPERPSSPQAPPAPPGAPGSPYAPAAHQPASGLAITSLILGIVGMCVPLVNIAAIVCGAINLGKGKGGRGLAITGVILGSIGVFSSCGLSVLFPALHRARDAASRVACASQMRQIGMALFMYAAEHKDALPPDLPTLMANQSSGGMSLTGASFVCPAGKDTESPGSGAQAQAGSLEVGGHRSYVYIHFDRISRVRHPSTTVMLYEPIGNHANDGINVLFADCRVEWFDDVRARQILADLEAGNNPPRGIGGQ